MPDDARDALARAQAAGVTIDDTAPIDLARDDLAIDALLGVGSNRRPKARWPHASPSSNGGRDLLCVRPSAPAA
jgi:NAD(P)H-hydrate repair Nnr-like enzyme with NAD(P)H-hydrate epimerase domain